MKKIFLIVFGCDRRKLDGQRLTNYFLENNHMMVDNPKGADYIILLACSFSDISAKEAFDTIRKYKKKYDAELIVGGCLPAIQPEKLSEIFDGRTITTKDLNNNPDKIDKLIKGNKIKFKDIPDTNVHFQNFCYGHKSIDKDENESPLKKMKDTVESLHSQKFSVMPSLLVVINLFPKIRNYIFSRLIGEDSFVSNYLLNKALYHLRITWGCTGNCSYCGIKKAVGTIQSKPLETCLNEFKKGLESGYKEFLINADDSGAYGSDINLTFTQLLDELTEIKGNYKITISGLNPVWVVKYIGELERIVKKGKIKEVIVTIQSGSNRILKLMNRYNDAEKITDAYKRLKQAYPGLKLFLQMIVGFPTETEEDFEKSISFMEKFDFNIVNIFPFSCLPDTEAEKIEPKIPKKIMFRRLKRLKKNLKRNGYASIFIENAGYLFYKK